MPDISVGVDPLSWKSENLFSKTKGTFYVWNIIFSDFEIFCYNQVNLYTGTCGCTVVNITFYLTSFTRQLVQVTVIVPGRFVCPVIWENSPLQDREFGIRPFTLVVTRGFLHVLLAWRIPFDNVESFVWDTTFTYFNL